MFLSGIEVFLFNPYFLFSKNNLAFRPMPQKTYVALLAQPHFGNTIFPVYTAFGTLYANEE